MSVFRLLAIVVFLTVAAVNVLRLYFGWPITFNGIDIPLGFSGIPVALGLLLALGLWQEAAAAAPSPDARPASISEAALIHLMNVNEKVSMSNDVLDAAFPPGQIFKEGPGRDKLLELMRKLHVKARFDGGHASTVTFEREHTQ